MRPGFDILLCAIVLAVSTFQLNYSEVFESTSPLPTSATPEGLHLGTHSVDQTGLELRSARLCLPSEFWDQTHMLPGPVIGVFLKLVFFSFTTLVSGDAFSFRTGEAEVLPLL